MRSLVILLLTVVFSIQAEDGIRHSHKGLEFRRVLVRSAVFRRQTARGSLRCGSSDHELVVWPQRTRPVLHPSVAGCDLLFPAQGHRPTDPVLQSFADRVLGLGILLWPGRWTPPDRWSRAGVADHAFDRAERDDVRAGNSVFGESASDNAWPLHRLASRSEEHT